MAESVTGKVAGNISSVYSIIRQKTHDIHDTFESLAMGNDHQQRIVNNFHLNNSLNHQLTHIFLIENITIDVNSIIELYIRRECFR